MSAASSHPFYVDRLGWALARSLRAGDVLVLSNGELVTVEWVQHEILESPIKVYNFEVEEFHTYFVGESGVWVHNQGCKDEAIVYRGLREDEIPQEGLTAKKPDRGMTIEGHVGSGSRNKGSQFISISKDIDVAKMYAGENGRVVSIRLDKLGSDTVIYDLTDEVLLNKTIKNPRTKNFARKSQEVLIEGYIPPEAIEILK